MDQDLRNKLRNVVTQCRKLLEDAIAQELEGKYGIFAKKDQVTADPSAKMTHLSDEEQEARKDILDHYAHIKARGFKPKDALEQLIREIAFTHLNRLCAYKMMEAREVYVGGQKFREAVSRGVNSNGVKFYLAEHPDEERLFNTGHQDVAYRHFLDWLGGALSDEIGVLFHPNDPANRLYPRQKTLDEVLDLLNGGGIKAEETELREQWPLIWSQDETIGWVYQYFTPKDLREKARKESPAPRNSYELAFRNQFFTPRYVVEFLTDNTLGRIWYEMRKGETKLAKEGDPAECRYMVRRPTEIFLNEGEQPPEEAVEGKDDLSQEELLKLPVHIPHRPKKDPRELKILDPACGSGHFLLYCFDLLQTIYEEAYDDPDLGPALRQDYPTLDDLRRDVPRLILAHNLHGIDIDLRASQIAALALWLRCQRAYQEMGLKKDRPQITRSNFVCAEPMPGEEQMLKEFVGQLEPKVLGQVVEVVFDKMKLAGEAGSLLKIEEEIRDAVAAAKKQYVRETTHAINRKGHTLLFSEAEMDRLKTGPQQGDLFDVSDITDDHFFEQAEARVVDALRAYAEEAQNGQRLQRRLFSQDAVRGFAFVDLCQKRYDVVLMNPPFGAASLPSGDYIASRYTIAKHDMYSASIRRGLQLLNGTGFLGAITNRTGFFLSDFSAFREEVLLGSGRLSIIADLGDGVLDGAKVATAAYTIGVQLNAKGGDSLWIRLLSEDVEKKGLALASTILSMIGGQRSLWPIFLVENVTFGSLSGSPFAYWVDADKRAVLAKACTFEPDWGIARTGLQGLGADDRFIRVFWEVPRRELVSDRRWVAFAKGGDSTAWYLSPYLVTDWENDGERQREFALQKYGSVTRKITGISLFGRPGITYTTYTNKGFRPRVLPEGSIFSLAGSGIFGESVPLTEVLAYLNSSFVQFFLTMTTDGRKWDPGYIKRVPVPDGTLNLEHLADEAIRVRRCLEMSNEVSRNFVHPFSDDPKGFHGIEDLVSAIDQHRVDSAISLDRVREEIDTRVFTAFGFDEGEMREIKREVAVFLASAADAEETGDEKLRGRNGKNPDVSIGFIGQLVSYCIGCINGLWDVRKVSVSLETLDPSDAFAPLQTCSPGMLQGPVGLPATPEDVPQDYPIRIDWDGILVDDSEHPDDIIRRVRQVLEVIWKERAYSIENEACVTLGVKTLRDYFRKPGKGGFWDDHITRYSKSRRKAPIYWLLRSSKKNYAIWLYYHRLDKDLLFKALVNYVEPKIRLETSRLESLRSQKAAAGESGKEAKRLAKDVERQEDFLSELRDFEDKLRRAANLHLEPDLNDGVVLNIAPLWELVPWKVAKKYWDELLDGKYEWSSIGKQLREKGLVK